MYKSNQLLFVKGKRLPYKPCRGNHVPNKSLRETVQNRLLPLNNTTLQSICLWCGAAGWATHCHCYADKGSVCFVVWDKQIYLRVHALKPASDKGFENSIQGGLGIWKGLKRVYIALLYLKGKGVRGQIGYYKNKLFQRASLFW